MTPRVDLLDWDTEFWGVRAARVHLDEQSQLGWVDQRLDQLGVEWASLLVPSSHHRLVTAAVRAGYEVVDTRYEMSLPLEPLVPGSSSIPDRARATLADELELTAIAGNAFSDSRFFNDAGLDDARCAEFYETWLRNSLEGALADVVIVEHVGPEIAGFATVRLDRQHASLPLVAVAPRHHGIGVGRRLLATTIAWIESQGSGTVERVDVVTQLTNVPAIRLYSGAGFRLTNSGVWLHRWRT